MLTLSLVHKIYQTIKGDIQSSLRQQDYAHALVAIDTYAAIAQFVNDEFRDDTIENVLKFIGEECIGIRQSSDGTDSKKIIFYDQIGSTACLAQQYLRALNQLGYEIFYIFEKREENIRPNLQSEVEQLCAKVSCYYGDYSIEKAKAIQDEIISFGANKLLIQSPAFGALGSAILYSLRGIQKYRIVPGDHHFFVGIDCVDYLIEFRDFGINVDLKRRNVPIGKIRKLMYYPIVESSVPFKGFPSDIPNDSIVIAAAAHEYKFHGSNRFFDIVQYILDKYPNTIFLFIGGKSKVVDDFVRRENLEGRFFSLGYRHDFIECMKHIDVFMNSYPWGSALTSMTAAYFKNPIISFHNKKEAANGLNSWFRETNISFSEEPALFEYIDGVIRNVEFRRREGEKIKSLLQTPEGFAIELDKILSSSLESPIGFQKMDIDYLRDRVNRYIDVQNTFFPSIYDRLLMGYGLKTLSKFPFLLHNKQFLKHLIFRTRKTLSKKLKH